MSETPAPLTLITPDKVSLEIKDPVDPTALTQVQSILSEIRPQSTIVPSALLSVAKRLGDIPENTTNNTTTYTVTKEECQKAFENLSDTERKSLVNIHKRVKVFAEAQRKSVVDVEIDIPGGKAGHTVSPCNAAGCYAPGG
eukprot:CAMPEP_0185734058 /NCGR_PEP_ID=MMETSP1171-20130828/21276_1 /TAXON_ID=374046 /ORGANISM="Helicotheca tamensis, Strain CCMP826" /LENGTH=140 /DNA_ID=CAMNT_0028403951 /DNA_START=67 /DNA_END=485 /DNA_ORIENTATION=+